LKTKLYSIEFIRAVCAIGIICFHYACGAAFESPFCLEYANGSWGDIFVIIFFVMSGGVLFYNNKEIGSLSKFYYKRFKAIFPSFYVAYLYFFLKNVIQTKKFFYNSSANPFTLLLSVIGMDGYLNYIAPNYYILGEWFLGAIIILYILYPLLLKGLKNKPKKTTILVICAYLTIVFYNVFEMNPFRSIFTCLFAFYMGMLLFKYKELFHNKIILIFSIGVVAILSWYTIPFRYGMLLEEVYGIAMFMVLYNVGILITKNFFVQKIVCLLGGVSYQIFLLQHIIIAKSQMFYNPMTMSDYWKMLIFTILITIFFSYILKRVVKFLLNSKNYRKFENYVLRGEEHSVS